MNVVARTRRICRDRIAGIGTFVSASLTRSVFCPPASFARAFAYRIVARSIVARRDSSRSAGYSVRN